MNQEFLDYFANRTKVRGDDVFRRAASVKKRWEKVVKDSKSDESDYRVGFVLAHNIALQILSSMFDADGNPIRSEEDFSELICAIGFMKRLVESGDDKYSSEGFADGVGYVIAEITAVIDEQ